MKICDILVQPPLSVDDLPSYGVPWGDVFRFDETMSNNYGFWPSDEAEADLKNLNAIQRTYWADRTQGRELNCIFIDEIPVVLYETTDSWDGVGQTWVLDGELYMQLYDTLKEKKVLTLHSLDEDIDSSYIGITTPPGGYYS